MQLVNNLVALARLLHRERPGLAVIMESGGVSRATAFRQLNTLRESFGMVIDFSDERYSISDYGVINPRKL